MIIPKQYTNNINRNLGIECTVHHIETTKDEQFPIETTDCTETADHSEFQNIVNPRYQNKYPEPRPAE